MELTHDEKRSILNQHIKNIVINQYNLHVALVAEEAAATPNEVAISNINNDIASEQAKYDALMAEYNSLPE
jgi:uncharacterized protein YlxP (DUF503 family)